MITGGIMTTKITCLLMLVTFLFWSIDGVSHSGRTDKNGGHKNRKTGQYHYHNKPPKPKPSKQEAPKQEAPKSKPSPEFDELMKKKELVKKKELREGYYRMSSCLNITIPILIGVGMILVYAVY